MAACAVLALNVLFAGYASAAPEDEVRATFERFVTAQNAHDVKAVEALLQEFPDFLWITRGVPVWGREAALKRFEALYEGTWHLDPEAAGIKVMMIGDAAAQIYVPIMFNIGASGQSAQPTRFLMKFSSWSKQLGPGRCRAYCRYLPPPNRPIEAGNRPRARFWCGKVGASQGM